MAKKSCKVEGCDNRAWQLDVCNLHALERFRSQRKVRPKEERLAEGKRLLRARAQELGIVLADQPQPVFATAKGGRRKVRSPVA